MIGGGIFTILDKLKDIEKLLGDNKMNNILFLECFSPNNMLFIMGLELVLIIIAAIAIATIVLSVTGLFLAGRVEKVLEDLDE
jgi:hypothetical protein